MQLAHDGESVEYHAWRELRRERELGELPVDFPGALLGKAIDANNESREVVRAAAFESFARDQSRGGIQIRAMIVDGVDHEARVRELVHAIGGEHEDVTLLQPQRLVVDVEVRVNAERAAEVTLLAGHPDAVVVGELLEQPVTQAVDAAHLRRETGVRWWT